MGRPIQMVVEVEPGADDKRQTLTKSIDTAILMAGMRIRAGTYRVTIEPLTKKQLAAEAAESDAADAFLDEVSDLDKKWRRGDPSPRAEVLREKDQKT